MSLNLSSSTPAAPTGSSLVTFQTDGSGNVSGYVDSSAAVLPAIDTTGLTANVSITTLFAVTDAGVYRVSGYVVETTPDGASSTLPKLTITWVDADTSVTVHKDITATQAGNTAGTFDQGDVRVSAAASSNIQYTLSGYVSGTPATMTYAIHLTIEQVF
jgi:hypothetical protein